MEAVRIATKQDLRELILKCYKQCISPNTAGLNISFNPSNTKEKTTLIRVEIPKEQQPKFRALSMMSDTSAVNDFGSSLESASSGELKLSLCRTQCLKEEDEFLFHEVISLTIACTYQIEE